MACLRAVRCTRRRRTRRGFGWLVGRADVHGRGDLPGDTTQDGSRLLPTGTNRGRVVAGHTARRGKAADPAPPTMRYVTRRARHERSRVAPGAASDCRVLRGPPRGQRWAL